MPLPHDSVQARPQFHPQRLHPRFARLFSVASRTPRGLAAAAEVLSPLAFDPTPSDTENARRSDLARATVAVCGFPRTGTTFIQNAVNHALGDESACWKNHDPLAIPGYARAGTPTWITLRDPASTVVSWSLYHHDEPSLSRLAQRLAVYSAWHREARRALRLPLVTVVDFAAFSSDPEAVIFRHLGRRAIAPISVTSVATRVHATNARDNLGLQQANLPDARRDALKEPYWELLADRRLRRRLSEATGIYESLLT